MTPKTTGSAERHIGTGRMNKSKHLAIYSLGVISFLLGSIGLLLPILPTTVFWIVATWCFLRTNPALAEKILAKPGIGSTIKDYLEFHIISRPTKRLITLIMLAAYALLVTVHGWSTTSFISAIVMLMVTLWIWSHPEVGISPKVTSGISKPDVTD